MTTRLESLDFLKGIAIFLIIYSHIDLFSFGHLTTFSYIEIGRLFMVPLFFFISGFFLPITKSFSYHEMYTFIRKKFIRVLFPAIIFAIPLKLFTNFGISAYWFLITLFEFFVIFSIVMLFKQRKHYRLITLFLISSLFIYPPILEALDKFPILFLSKLKMFIFFILGYSTKNYKITIDSFLNNKYTKLIITLSTAIIVFGNFFHKQALEQHTFFALGVSILCVICCYSLFNQQTTTLITKPVIYIGKHTLEIYLLHYFFLPIKIPTIGSYFQEHPMPSIEFCISSLLAVLIIIFCVITYKIIGKSSLLGKYLFGYKTL